MKPTFDLTRASNGERVRILTPGCATGGAYVEGTSVLPPGADASPYHEHPKQDERLEVVSGTIMVRMGGRFKVAGPGSTVVIPRGKAHEVANVGREEAEVVWRFTPALRTDAFLRASIVAERRRGGRIRTLVGRLAVAGEYFAEYRKATMPWSLQWLASRLARAAQGAGGRNAEARGAIGPRLGERAGAAG
jgi:quercetin dioxygenase-like cupin family protein